MQGESKCDPMTAAKKNKPPRCPYCVTGAEFKLMKVLENGRQICDSCGHIVFPEDRASWCPCPRCISFKISFKVRGPRR
jgi:predicted RNA-binding Zn-ribbon protein involved in translation (DUF1610 family)